MNYAEIKYCDIANGVGVRTTLFVSGCRHHCEGCFNPVQWDFAAGEPFTPEVEQKIMESLEPPYVAGLTILGGEPMEMENQAGLLPFLRRVRERFPQKSIWVYTGFTWEALTQGPSRATSEMVPQLLSLVDVLVDGPFVLPLKDISLRFRGSSNQRLIDVPATLASGEVTLWQDEPVFSSHAW
jgi:anaerobic ribonucleoside-triphosphate reductase activating protein